MDRVANLDSLRRAVEQAPEAVVGVAPDGRRVLVLERLSADTRVLTKYGLALRWMAERGGPAERVCSGVWLVGELGEERAERGGSVVAGGAGRAASAQPVSPASMLGFGED